MPEELERRVYQGFVSELVNRITDDMLKQGPEETHRTEEIIEERLSQLSKAEREAIQSDLGLKELTGRHLRQFIVGGGLAGALLGGAASTGMGIYLAATTVTHAFFTTVLGITLPFAAYTGLVSGMSFLLSPFGALAVIGGGGLLAYNRLRSVLDTRTLAWAVVAITEADNHR